MNNTQSFPLIFPFIWQAVTAQVMENSGYNSIYCLEKTLSHG